MDITELKMGDIFAFRNTDAKEAPNSCPDCGRTYLNRESVQVKVQSRPNPVWAGCIDCWVKRTSPEMCQSFIKES